MNIAATLSADLRARSTFLPYCPLCSFVSIPDMPDILHGPSFREFRGIVKIDQCCSLSATGDQFDSKSDAAAWWRKRRLEPVTEIATDNRRRNCIAKLGAKNLEPIE